MEGGITEKYQYLDNCDAIILPEMGGAIPYSSRGDLAKTNYLVV
jgi:hypothetical protein